MRKIKSTKDFDKVIYLMFCSVMFGFASFITLFWTFLTAYFSGAKATIVTINEYGEANWELFLFFILLDFFIISIVYGYKRIFKKEKA